MSTESFYKTHCLLQAIVITACVLLDAQYQDYLLLKFLGTFNKLSLARKGKIPSYSVLTPLTHTDAQLRTCLSVT